MLLLTPALSHAQVVISEIVYDPEGADTGNEWVELFNAGSSAVNITGWKINDGSNHVFNEPGENGSKGSMSISSGGYLILAGDALLFAQTYPSVANVIDTVLSMSNAGDTVTLINAEAATVDILAYGEDAAPSAALHRVSVGGTTLSVGAPTPGTGSLSASAQTGVETSTTTQTQTQSQSQTSGGGSYPVEPQIIADAGKDKVVVVGADIALAGKAFKKTGEPMGPSGVRFLWNFGDGKTAEGAQVMHRWAHPGRYAVTLDVSANVYSASHRIIVTAKEAQFALATLPDGSAVIENRSPDELDLSFWFVRDGVSHFALPEDTVILVGEKIIIPPDSLGFAAHDGWSLLYPNGAVANTAPLAKPTIIHAKADTAAPVAMVINRPKAAVEKNTEETIAPEEITTIQDAQLGAVIAAAGPGLSQSKKGGLLNQWTIGLALLVSLGAAGAFFASRARRGGWEIVEEQN